MYSSLSGSTFPLIFTGQIVHRTRSKSPVHSFTIPFLDDVQDQSKGDSPGPESPKKIAERSLLDSTGRPPYSPSYVARIDLFIE